MASEIRLLRHGLRMVIRLVDRDGSVVPFERWCG